MVVMVIVIMYITSITVLFSVLVLVLHKEKFDKYWENWSRAKEKKEKTCSWCRFYKKRKKNREKNLQACKIQEKRKYIDHFDWYVHIFMLVHRNKVLWDNFVLRKARKKNALTKLASLGKKKKKQLEKSSLLTDFENFPNICNHEN